MPEGQQAVSRSQPKACAARDGLSGTAIRREPQHSSTAVDHSAAQAQTTKKNKFHFPIQNACKVINKIWLMPKHKPSTNSFPTNKPAMISSNHSNLLLMLESSMPMAIVKRSDDDIAADFFQDLLTA